jgi:iron complex outermembrane receptor protein
MNRGHPEFTFRVQHAAAPLALAICALAPCSMAGQAPDSARAEAERDTLPVYRTSEIAVQVARSVAALAGLPYAISVADRSAVQVGERTVSLDEALRFVPGLFVHNRRNYSLGDRVTVRGQGARAQFGVRGVRVLADGIPLTLADGQSTLTNLDLASVGRVEVIRGSASALYGNAGGGVLSYRTELPVDQSLLLEPRLTGGSHGFLQTRLKASGSTGGVSYLGSLSYLRTDGFRDFSEAEVFRANVRVAGRVGETGEVRGLLNLYSTPFAQNPSSLSLEDARDNPRMARSFIISQGSGEDATQGQGGVALDLPLGETARFRATAWGLWRDLWNPIPGRIIQIDRLGGGFRSEVAGSLGRDISWVGGVDLELQRDERMESENLGVDEDVPESRAQEGELLLDQRERVLGLGPFLRVGVELGERWTLTLGGRLDVYHFEADDRLLTDGDDSGKRTFTEFSPTAGLAFEATDWLQVYGNFSTAFQTPTTSELSNQPDGSGGFNPDLEPERIVGGELGVRGSFQDARLGYGVSAFLANVKDALIPFEGPTEEVFFRNAGEVGRSGVEVAVGWQPHSAWRVELAQTIQRLRFEEFEVDGDDLAGKDEPGVPNHWLTLGLTHTPDLGLRTEVNFRWVDAYPVDDANTAFNDSYRVVDLRLSLDRTQRGWPLRMFLGIDNLFDERYNGSVVPNAFGARYYEPAPGFEVYGGVSWPIGSTRGSP